MGYLQIRKRHKQIEVRNFQKISGILADWGLNCSLIYDDNQGADFIARHMQTHETIPIQLKSRLTIAKKYLKHENLWIAFPVGRRWKGIEIRDWYLVKHYELVEIVGQVTNWLETDSWNKGEYHSQSPSKDLLEKIHLNKIGFESNQELMTLVE